MLKSRKNPLPEYLPGQLTLERGTARDYAELSAFHYIAPEPATFARVWVVHYHDPHRRPYRHPPRPVAVGVLSYPVPSCTARELFLGRSALDRSSNLRFANRHVRTISRIIVHPQFRALGLSTILVRCICRNCKTRYVEAIAAMGRVHPFFERAGMKRIDPLDRAKPVYFIFDRKEQPR